VKAVQRCDDPKYFGPRGSVRAIRLFPLDSVGVPGMRVLPGPTEMDALYDELALLLARADALDPESDTAKQIAEVEAKLQRYEAAEAELWRREVEARLPVPLAEVVAFNEELADVIARARDRAAENPDPQDP
jgi:hypothetical protein